MIAFSVPDMSCDSCVATVKAAVSSVDPQARAAVDLEAQRVTVETTATGAAVIEVLDAAGYPARVAR